MVCSICGAALTAAVKFCPRCGAPYNSTTPDRPILTITGPGGAQSFELAPGTVTIGRAPDNTLCLDHDQISRYHACLEPQNTGWTLTDLGSRNGTCRNGARLEPRRPEPFLETDTVTIGPFTLQIQLAAGAPAFSPAPAAASSTRLMGAAPPAPSMVIDLQGRGTLRIGRAPDNDLAIDHPLVSRHHARIEQDGQVRIVDLGSTNGTYVNGRRITGPTVLGENAVVQIANTRLVLSAGKMQQFDQEGTLSVDALHLTKTVGKGLQILCDVSLSIPPREFVAIVGASGSGKTTLLDALNGLRPATQGAVFYGGTDLYQNIDAYRNVVGYVPQDDIIHRELTVYSVLNYAAQLRLPRDATAAERDRCIQEVLQELGLEQRRDTPIAKLSGGQRKRVSIGVELLSKPGLLFLDEPTSGLDPSTETNMMRLLRHLADQGRTVLLVTHVTGNISLCDKVVILARGGRMVYYGPPQEALQYFQVKDFVDIYDRLETGEPEEWQKRFEQTPQFQSNVSRPLQAHVHSYTTGPRPKKMQPAFRGVSSLRQFLILSRRNIEILTRDRASLILMILMAPLLGLMDFVSAKPTLFDIQLGSAQQAMTILFSAGLKCVLVGSLASMREIVKEIEIYRRERMVGLRIGPYVLAKVWFLLVLALYQALMFVILKAVAIPSMPHDAQALSEMYVTLTLATLASMVLGLLISALSPNANVAPLLTILVLIPQIIFGGGVIPLKSVASGKALSNATITKWTFYPMVQSSRLGADIAQDACWNVNTALADRSFSPPQETDEFKILQRWQDQLTEDYKKQNCRCLGPNVFTSCSVPGIAADLTAEDKLAVESSEPTRPSGISAPPSPPAAPAPPPPQPNCNQLLADCQRDLKNWSAAMENYRAEMTSWSDQMNAWKSSVDNYQANAQVYQEDMNTWQAAYGDWKTRRDKAITRAEGLVRKLYEDYADAFRIDIRASWLMLGVITSISMAAVVLALKLKERGG